MYGDFKEYRGLYTGNHLEHYGVRGMKWKNGKRPFAYSVHTNPDGSPGTVMYNTKSAVGNGAGAAGAAAQAGKDKKAKIAAQKKVEAAKKKSLKYRVKYKTTNGLNKIKKSKKKIKNTLRVTDGEWHEAPMTRRQFRAVSKYLQQ